MLQTDSWACSKSSGRYRYGAWANSEIFMVGPLLRCGRVRAAAVRRWSSDGGGDVVHAVRVVDPVALRRIEVEHSRRVEQREPDHREAPAIEEQWLLVGAGFRGDDLPY